MTQDKAKKLMKYASDLANRLSSPTPEKHKYNPATYRQFLTRELDTATKQLNEYKLQGLDKK